MLQRIDDPNIQWVKMYTCSVCGNRWMFSEQEVHVTAPAEGEWGDDPSRFWVLCPTCRNKTCVGGMLRYSIRNEMALKAAVKRRKESEAETLSEVRK